MTAFGKSKWVKELPEKLSELSQKRFVERVFLNSLWDKLLLTVFGLFVVVLMPIYFKLNKVAAVGGDCFWWVHINVCLNFERLLVGILLFLRRSGRWQMAGLIINAVFGLELVVSAQVWWWAVARADYKCRLWFGFLLYFASLAEAGCQGWL